MRQNDTLVSVRFNFSIYRLVVHRTLYFLLLLQLCARYKGDGFPSAISVTVYDFRSQNGTLCILIWR